MKNKMMKQCLKVLAAAILVGGMTINVPAMAQDLIDLDPADEIMEEESSPLPDEIVEEEGSYLSNEILGATDEIVSDHVQYTLDSENCTATVTGYTDGLPASVTIPASFKSDKTTYFVTAIKEGAFNSCTSLKSLTIAGDDVNVGKNAFSESSLETVKFVGDGVILGDGAFAGCTKLTKVEFAGTAESIGAGAFTYCITLTDFTIPEGITGIEPRVFMSCSSLANISIPSSIKSIGEMAFGSCTSLKDLTIVGDDVTIGTNAFSGSSLETVKFTGDGVILGNGAFASCTHLTKVEFAGTVGSIGRSAFSSCTALTDINIPSGTDIGEAAFYGCTSLKNLTIAGDDVNVGKNAFSESSLESVKFTGNRVILGDGAFAGCTKLTKVEFAGTAESIGAGAFTYCIALTDFTIPKGITGIEPRVFMSCSSLANISIPSSIKSIGEMAFDSCTSLKDLTIVGDDVTIGTNAFSGSSLETVKFTGDGVILGGASFANCTKLTKVEFAGTVGSIGGRAFMGCSALTDINIPSGTDIGEAVFYGCTSLKNFTIEGDNVTVGKAAFSESSLETVTFTGDGVILGDGAFASCTSLKKVEFAGSIKSMGKSAFTSCSSLSDINIPSGTNIGEGAFTGCTSLTDLTIAGDDVTVSKSAFAGSSVESVTFTGDGVILGDGAFASCTSLKKVEFTGTIKSMGTAVFTSCSSLTDINIPSGTNIGEGAFTGCTSLTDLTIAGDDVTVSKSAFAGSSVESVTFTGDGVILGDGAFASCTSLKKVEFAGSIKSMGKSAFTSCSSLTDINIPSGTNIGEGAFTGCTSLTDLTIAGDDVTVSKSAFAGSSVESVTFTGDGVILGDGAFASCTSLKKVEFAGSIKSMGKSAFTGCSSLSDINIPSGTNIGEGAFVGCTSLKRNFIIKGDNVTVGKGAFVDTALISVTFTGNGVTLGDSAFATCTSLNTVNFEGTVKSLGAHAFSGCSALTDINIPSGTNIGDAAFIGCTSLKKNFTIEGDNVTVGKAAFIETSLESVKFTGNGVTLGDSAFASCTSLKKVEFAGTVKSLGAGAFSSCSALTDINIPSGTNIGDTAFLGCTSLKKNFTIEGDNVTVGKGAFIDTPLISMTFKGNGVTLGDSAFATCTSLNTVNFEGTVKSIGAGAFAGCTSLRDFNITLENGIGKAAFNGCTSLMNLTIGGGNINIGAGAFGGSSLHNVTFTGDGVTLGDSAFAGCDNLGMVRFQGTVESIGESAFAYCTGITEISIPGSYTSIEPRAFEGCSCLQLISIPGSVTSLGKNAFWHCDYLRHIYFGGTRAQWEKVQMGENCLSTEGPDGSLCDLNPTIHCMEYGVEAVASPAQGGIVTVSNMWNSNCSYVLTATPATGYHFVNWKFTDGQTSTNNPCTLGISADTTVTACFEIDKYTVTWLDYDDSLIDTTMVEYGKIPTHADPAREPSGSREYEFSGWTPKVVAATGDTTYKATYKALYKITVKTNGNGTATANMEKAAFGTTVRLQAVPDSGYKFVEWITTNPFVSISDKTAAKTSFTMPTDDVVITATFAEIKEAKIKSAPEFVNGWEYDGESHEIIKSNGSASFGTIKFAVTSDGSIPEDRDYVVNSRTRSVKLKDAGKYRVYYKAFGNTGYDDSDVESVELTISPKSVTVSGITALDKVYDGTLTATLDTTKAVISGLSDKDSGKVTVSARGTFADVNYGEDKPVFISNLKLEGERAANYRLDIANSQSQTTGSIIQGKRPSYTVRIRVKGDGSVSDGGKYLSGETCTAKATPAEGAAFMGWEKDGVIVSTEPDYSFIVTENVTITGIFSDPATTKYYVGFDSQGGSPVGSISGVIPGTTINLPEDPTKEGYDFEGWFTKPDGNGELFTAGSTVNESMVLYASWIAKGFLINGIEETGYIYTGNAISISTVKIYYKDRLLTKGTDYNIKFSNNTNVGNNALITVTGKGNYKGKETTTFTIRPKSIDSADVSVSEISSVKEGRNNYTPVPAIKYNKKNLKKGTDFTIVYYKTLNDAKDKIGPVTPQKAGTYYARIDGIKNYTGTVIESFVIAGTDEIPVSKLNVGKIADQLYNAGQEVVPEPVVKDGKTVLQKNTHYTLFWSNNTEIGTGTVAITGIKPYVGSRTITFNIKGIPMNKVSVGGIPRSAVYDGTEKKPVLTLSYKAGNRGEAQPVQYALKEDYDGLDAGAKAAIDCILTFENNVNVGTATVTLKGVHRFSGTVSKTFRIQQFTVTSDPDDLFKVTLAESSYPFAKGGVKPKPVVTFKGKVLEEGRDYTLGYANNTVFGGKNKPTVKVNGKGNFKGTDTSATFAIGQADMASTGVKVIANDVVYQNKAGKWVSKITVAGPDGKALSAGTDYDKIITYTNAETGAEIGAKDIVPAGTVIKVKVNGKGAYKGFAEGTYRILSAGRDIGKLSVTVEPKTVTGKPIILTKEDIIWKNGKNIINDVTFEIDESTYKSNVNKGKASVVVRGTGDWGGSKTITFPIDSRGFIWWWRNL